MNQILEYSENRGSSNGNGSDKIVKFFAIVLVVFAVMLICIVVKGKVSNDTEIIPEEDNTKAEIEVEIDGTKAIINVNHDKKIEKLIYSWNNGTERLIQGKGTTLNEEIDVPSGNNTLHIKVVDEVGEETLFNEEVEAEQGIDIKNPEINLEVTEEAKLKIIATDETELSFITYRWNDENEEKITVDDDKTTIETEIEILKGENDLTIIAVDSSNNTTTERKSFTGRTKPNIKVTLSEDGSSISIDINDEYGIESCKFNFNGVEYNVAGDDEKPTYMGFSQNLDVGNNKIILTVTNIYGISNVFNGECTYGDSSENRIIDNSEENMENTENTENTAEDEENNEEQNTEN